MNNRKVDATEAVVRAGKPRPGGGGASIACEGAEKIASDYASYLGDESRLSGGAASIISFPKSEAEISALLSEMNRRGIPLTVSGARTGIVGGAVPRGGALLSLEKMDRLLDLGRDVKTGEWFVRAEPGILLSALHRKIEKKDLGELKGSPSLSDPAALEEFLNSPASFFYPVDATESSATLGGTVATNASGERSFRYGPTRRYVRALRVVLAGGDVLALRRGEATASPAGTFDIVLGDGSVARVSVPRYAVPAVKCAAGYCAGPGMDLLDLFIGSEGTLGVVSEVELAIIEQPAGILSLVPFFPSEQEAQEFFFRVRDKLPGSLVYEYFDSAALNTLRRKQESDGPGSSIPPLPEKAGGAIFLELACREEDLESVSSLLEGILQKSRSSLDDTWTGMEPAEREKVRALRHALPEAINEQVAKNKLACPAVHKVSTDMAVPAEHLREMLSLYYGLIRRSNIPAVVFGHIGENHLHVNWLPKNEAELARAKEICLEFARKAVALGGTVSAEHGIGKIKHPFLEVMYGAEGLAEMARVKKALDPRGILGRGNIFPESLLPPLPG